MPRNMNTTNQPPAAGNAYAAALPYAVDEDGEGDDVFVIRLLHSLNDEAGKIKHGCISYAL